MKRWKVATGVAFVTFLAYLPALHNQFVSWDDPENFLANPHYRGLGWAQLTWMFTKSAKLGNFIPVTWMTFGADYLAWGMNPFGYHLTNVILHALNAGLLFWLILILFGRARPKEETQERLRLWLAAAAGALFFAVHPLRVESVAWVTERRDILSGAFFLGTLLSYLHFVTKPADDPRRPAWYGATLLLYALGLLSKPMLMTLPVILILLDIYPLQRTGHTKEKIPFWVLAIVAAGTAVFNQTRAGDMASFARLGIASRIGVAGYGACFYLWKTIWPLGLNPLHPLFPMPEHFRFLGLSGAICVILITFALYRKRKRWPAALAVWIYYLVTLSPVSGLAQSGDQLVADRYSYLPGMGGALLFGMVLLGGRASGFRVRAAAGLVLLAGLAGLTWAQCGVWHDSKTLWEAVLRRSPDNFSALNNYGVVLQNEGHAEDAIRYFRRAIELNPEYAFAHSNLGLALFRQGKTAEAVDEFEKALADNPRDLTAHASLGVIFAGQGRIDAAMEHLHKALEVNPDSVLVNNNVGMLLMSQGRVLEAMERFQISLQADPRQATVHYYLAIALASQGYRDQSADQLEQANRYRASGAPEYRLK